MHIFVMGQMNTCIVFHFYFLEQTDMGSMTDTDASFDDAYIQREKQAICGGFLCKNIFLSKNMNPYIN